MSRHNEQYIYTRADVMLGLAHVSGTLCDFECAIVAKYPQQHKVDDGVYTIDYRRTMALKQMLGMEMVETRRDNNVVRMRPHTISSFTPNARELMKLIHWSLNYLNVYDSREPYEPIRLDRAVTASIEKVNDWFNMLEARGVSIFERPQLCEPFTAPPEIIYANQYIRPEQFFIEYRRRMGMFRHLPMPMHAYAYPDYNNMVNIQNVYRLQ